VKQSEDSGQGKAGNESEGGGGWGVRGGGGGKWRGTDQKLGLGQVGAGPAPLLVPHSPWRF